MLCKTKQPLKFCLTIYRSLYTLLSQVFLCFTGRCVLEKLLWPIFPLPTMQTVGVFLNAMRTKALIFTLLKLTSFCKGNPQHHRHTFCVLSYALLVEIFRFENWPIFEAHFLTEINEILKTKLTIRFLDQIYVIPDKLKILQFDWLCK